MHLWNADAHGNTFRILLLGEREALATSYLHKLRKRKQWSFDTALVVKDEPNGCVSFRVLERDGSESKMCGNGLRAVAKILKNIRRAPSIVANNQEMRVERLNRGSYAVLLKAISHGQFSIDQTKDAPPKFRLIDVASEPHAVAILAHAERAPLAELGSLIVPRANCTIVSRLGKTTLLVRTYERGINRETHSCGTGACAAVHAMLENGLVPRQTIRVLMGGRTLRVHVDPSGLILDGEVHVRKHHEPLCVS